MTAALTAAATVAACAFFAASTVAIAEGAVNDWRVGYRRRAARAALLAIIDAGAAAGTLWLIVVLLVP